MLLLPCTVLQVMYGTSSGDALEPVVGPLPLHHVHYVTCNAVGLVGSFTVRKALERGPQPYVQGPLALCAHCRPLVSPVCLVVF